MFSSSQGDPPLHIASSNSLPSGNSELTARGGRALSHLSQAAKQGRLSSKGRRKTPSIMQGVAAIQLGPGILLSPLGNHTVRYAAIKGEHETGSKGSKRSRIKKRLSRFIHGEPNGTGTNTSHPVHHIGIALLEAKINPAALDPVTPVKSNSVTTAISSSGQVAIATAFIPAVQPQSTPASIGPLRLDIFPEDVAAPVLTTDPPKAHARIKETSQLVFCYSLPSKARSPLSSNGNSYGSEETPIDERQREWALTMDPIGQNHLHWLIDQLVKAFAQDQLKDAAAVTEIVLLGPVLDRETYRSLLSCFISKFEQTTPLDLTLLQGLVQLVECASTNYLVDNDLVSIATVLSRELSKTHTGNSDHPLQLMWALSRVLDTMVALEVKDVDRNRDHQPIKQLLGPLKDSEVVYLKYQATYAYQALQYAPDDETPLQTVWRYSQVAATAASAVSSVFKLDPAGLLDGIAKLLQSGVDAVRSGIETFNTLREGAEGVARASENRFDVIKKNSWYLALQGTALFIRQGRLSDFNQVVCQASCRQNVNFQWGVCRQLGEIAIDPLWDTRVRLQAIDFLGELYRSDTDWEPHADVKRWILTILMQISKLPDPIINDRAHTLLENLKKDGAIGFPHSYPLAIHLPLPVTSPLLVQVQEIPEVEYALHRLRMQRLAEYKQSVYIPPLAKPSLQAQDDKLFPLMEKVQDFLAGDAQVMLVLGDSGAGKSTFNRHLESKLWQDYNTGDRIPFFINLPALDRPKKELIAEQLREYRFSETQIQELERHRQFILICNGYDESQLTDNLHTTNHLNRSRQRDAKLLITCRTQYLGPDYRDRFVPNADAQYHGAANDLFVEAVIAPFSRGQIEDYVEQYVPPEPRDWVKKDYMDKLTTIPNLMDLVKNPFLLNLALEALPSVVQGKRKKLSRLRVTRVQLYDTFVEHWLRINKRRLQDHQLKDDKREALDVLLADGFERNAILYQKELATMIFQEQYGKPVVDYSHIIDRSTWKAKFFGLDPERRLLRDSSLLSRAGNQYRFVHRSVLEYFYSRTICEPADNKNKFAPPVHLESPVTSASIGDHPLSKRNLVTEPSIIQFLVERVQLVPSFKPHLLEIIKLSKSDAQASQAAANAITILVKSRVRFHGHDLRGIRIPGADLSGGQFDSAQFQGADMTGVNLTKSWIRQTDLSNASMGGVRFGELPLRGSLASVHSCAYSPDGKTLAMGLDRGDIIIYDTTTWARTQTYRGHRFRVSSLTYSPNSQQLVSGSWDHAVRLWNCLERSSVCAQRWNVDMVRAVAISPCGKQVASVGYEKSVRLWNAETGAADFVLTGHTKHVSSIAYSPNGWSIATGGDDGKIRIFDPKTGQSGMVWESGFSGVCCIAYSPDGYKIVSGHQGGELQLWEAVTGKAGRTWTGHSNFVSSASFSPNGQWIASASDDGTVKLWDTETLTLDSVFTGHSRGVTCVVFSPDNSQLASGSWDETVRLWDVSSTGSSLDYSDPVAIAAYSPDGQSLRSYSRPGTVRQHDAVSSDVTTDLACHSHDVDLLACSPDGLQIATAGSSNNGVTVRSATTMDTIRVLCGHKSRMTCITFSVCGQWIATGSKDKTVRLWGAHTGASGPILPGHELTVVSVAISQSGRQIVSVDGYGTLRVWEVDTGTPRQLESEWHASLVAYSPVGLQFASSHDNGDIRLWDQQGEEPRHILRHGCAIEYFAFSSCGQWIAIACSREVWLWKSVLSESKEWSCITVVRGFSDAINSIAWRPQVLEFATGCKDGSLRVWRLVYESGGWSVRLVWSFGYTALVATGAVLKDSTGLSHINQQLLEQHGAIDVFSLVEEDGSK